MSKKKLLFGGDIRPNTFIGGIGGSINTASLLATKLGIAVGRISNFEIVGSEVRCRISGNYIIPINSFEDNTSLAYYFDNNRLVTDLNNCFRGVINLIRITFNGIINFNLASCFYNTPSLRLIEMRNCLSIILAASNPFLNVNNCRIYIPNCTNLGGSSGSDNVFQGIGSNNILYANPSLQTNNAGNPDGDITAFLAVAGNTVCYVTNFTPPSKVTTITAGNTYNTSIQINITAPSSTNAIDYYEVYVNGVYRQNIQNGGYVTGLIKNTAFNIQIVARDIFYNESPISDGVLLTTANLNKSVYAADLLAYYKLDSNLNDSVGSNNGTTTSVSYATAKVSNGMVFNGTTSFGEIPDNNVFSFCDGSGDKAFSIGMFVKFATVGVYILIDKRDNLTTGNEWTFYFSGTKLIFRKISQSNDAIYENIEMAFVPTVGVLYHVAFSSNGLGNDKVYVNAVSSSTKITTGTYVKMINTTSRVVLGRQGYTASTYLNGQIDCLSFHNKALNAGEWSDIISIYNSGTDLI